MLPHTRFLAHQTSDNWYIEKNVAKVKSFLDETTLYNTYKLASPQGAVFFATLCRAKNDLPAITQIRLWASFGVHRSWLIESEHDKIIFGDAQKNNYKPENLHLTVVPVAYRNRSGVVEVVEEWSLVVRESRDSRTPWQNFCRIKRKTLRISILIFRLKFCIFKAASLVVHESRDRRKKSEKNVRKTKTKNPFGLNFGVETSNLT